MNTQNIFTSSQIARACDGAALFGWPQATARGVCTDTRNILPGQAFFALEGERFDGHDFLPMAADGGASVFVISRWPNSWRPPTGTATVRVADTRTALLSLAAWHRRRLGAKVIAVTGSYGKSTVKAMLGAILKRQGHCTVAAASYNNRIGVALSLLAATARDDYVVLEMGTNHPGEIDELAAAARPHVAIITAVGEVHLEGLGSLAGVREAKAELIPHILPGGMLILNADSPHCAALAERFDGKVLTFGEDEGADVRAREVRTVAEGWGFEIGPASYLLPCSGRYNVLNATAAAAAAQALGVPAGAAAVALAGFEPPALRYQRVELGGVRFILDCYNSNPPAMRAATDCFLREPAPARRIVVCGDMLELGDRAKRLHRGIGAHLGASEVEALVAIGPLSRELVRGWHQTAAPGRPALHFESAEQAWWPLWQMLREGDTVLVKGSRAMRLEDIVQRISERLQERRKEAAA